MMLNVVGFRARRWLGRGLPGIDPCLVSNADGGWDMYSEEMGPPPVGLSTARPGDNHGLWKGTGAAESAVKDVLAAPRGGWAGLAVSGGSWERSTRLLGQGMPCEESSGSEGDVRIAGSGWGFLGLRRKENMA